MITLLMASSFCLNPENSIPVGLGRVYSENELVEKGFVNANDRDPTERCTPALASSGGTVGDGAELARPALCALAG